MIINSGLSYVNWISSLKLSDGDANTNATALNLVFHAFKISLS